MDRDKKTIAVVGASADRRKFGNMAVRAYNDAGWEVYPVNLSETTIEELAAYPRLSEVPVELDRISIYLPPEKTRRLLDEIASKGAGDVWFNPGSADPQILEEAKQAGLTVRNGCSITYIGKSPAQYM
jgi:predicted CoA-binding protein